MPDYDLGTARGKIELDASSLGRATAAFGGLGKVMIGMGALAVGAFAYAVKSAADFEKVMSAVGAVTNATSSQMAAMKEQALDLGASTVYGADQIGRAMEQLAKAGITIPEILGGATEATVTLAAAAGDELAGGIDQAAVVIANAMKTFGAGADELEHFADVLVGAAASSTLSVDDIATSMTYAGPVAASLGLSIDDLSTALAILGDRGIRGSTAGTSLRGVFLSLATQTPKATKVMEELGIITEDGTNRFFDLNGALKPLPEVMQILGDATKNLSEQERIAAFNAIFQRRAMNAAMILAEQGAAGFDKYAAAIARIKASDVAAKKLDNLSGDVTLLKNAVETLMIRVGLPFQEMLRGWVQSLNDLVRKLNEVNPELLAQVAMIAAVGGSVLIAIGSMLLMVSVVIRLYRNFILLKEAIGIVLGAVKLLTLSFLTNPIVLFVAALVALGVALYHAYHRSEEFRDRVDGALRALEPTFNAVKGFVENLVTQFGNLVEVIREGDDVAQGVAEVIDNMFGNTGKLVEPIRNLVTWLGNLDEMARTAFQYFADTVLPILWDFAVVVGKAVASAVSWFIDEGIPAIQRFADAVVEQIGMAVDWFGRNVAPIFTETASLVAAAFDRIIRVLKFFLPYFQWIWNGVGTVLKLALDIIESVVESILLVWDNLSDNLGRIITGTWQRVKQTIESALRIIRGIITAVTGLISGDWGKAWDGIKQIVSGAWALIGDIIQNAWFYIWNTLSLGVDLLISVWEVAWNTFFDIVSGVLGALLKFVQDSLAFLWKMIQNAWNLVKSTTINIWNAIFSWFATNIKRISTAVSTAIGLVLQYMRALWGQITGALGDIGGKLYAFFYNAWLRARGGVQTAVTLMINFVKSIPKKILDGLGNVGTMLLQAGKDIIGGLIDGIKSMIPDVGGALSAVGDKIGGFLPGSPVKEGPLKVLNRDYAGGQVVQMVVSGIMSQLPALRKAMAMTMGVSLPEQAISSLSTQSAAATGRGDTVISVTFEFPNITNADDAQAIEDAVGDSSVMTRLVSTIKAGRR